VERESLLWETPVTISVGIACLPDHSTTCEGLVRTADEALYSAKRSGRNRVVLSGV
jgi:diguanylate cyclase (GGDEF)-like protein